MNKYKHANLRSPYLEIAGAATLVALLSSSGSYALSFGVQYQPQQQSATTIVASSDEIMRVTSTFANTSDSIANETVTQGDIPNATLVEFVSNIEQIRGHLNQALINKDSGNNTLAQAHILHPIEEIYSSIEEELTNRNSTLNSTLSAGLQNLSSSVATATSEEVHDQIQSINELLNNSVQAVVEPSSEVSNNPAFNASVVARLLHVVGHEYEEAVANGTIRAIVEYQDAQAFIDRAESIFQSTASRINQSLAPIIGEVNESFSNLNGSIMNTEQPEAVERTINGIISELTEITGLSSQLIGEEAEGAEEQDPIAIINNIKSLLTEVIGAYRAQDYSGAENIAIEAYLENYEYIEAPLAQHDRQLMEQTEVMLREELRQMIMDRVPIEQIEQHIAMVNANLDRATELLQ
jgi:hypothetical protein